MNMWESALLYCVNAFLTGAKWLLSNKQIILSIFGSAWHKLLPIDAVLTSSHIFFYNSQNNQIIIRKTCPCKVYPLKPQFYIVKLGYAGVYLFFLFLLQNIDCGYSLEPPSRRGSNVYPQSMF